MYWSRTGSYFDLLEWLLLNILSWVGGWLLCTHVFKCRPRERLFSGVATGLLLFILFSNLFAQILSLPTAFWISSIFILGLGLFAAWRSSIRPWLSIGDLKYWGQMLAFSTLFILFTLINRGLAIFDDYSNLPIVSIIATGDVPPHFYLNPDKVLDYHYGLHLLAAGWVRIGGFFPWSALDLCKSFSVALAGILSILWLRRYIPEKVTWLWGGLFLLFNEGSRWLLLLIPSTTILKMGLGIQMIGSGLATGPDLYTALISPWKIEGGGPLPFPFAFISGISRPLSLAMGGNGALPLVALTLLLLLGKRRWRPLEGLLYGLLITSLALTSEHLFLIFWGGILLSVLLRWLQDHSSAKLLQWGWTLFPGLLLAPIMGGVLSSTALRWLNQATGKSPESGIGLPGMMFYWPPAFFSAHLGTLSLTDPNQILIALAEMGPVLFLAPLVTMTIMRAIRSGKILTGGLGVMAVMVFLAPLVIRFTERERDITRLTGTAFMIWMMLGLPYMWSIFKKGKVVTKSILSVVYLIAVLGGIALLPTQLVSIAKAQPSYFVQEPDTIMSRLYWDRIDKNAWILDPTFPYRPAVLFGRTTGPAYQDAYIRLPEFRDLLIKLDVLQIAQSGYSYVYIDRETWQNTTPVQRQAFLEPCVKVVFEQKTELGDFRRMFDIRKCQKAAFTIEQP